jgi:hypothetical protein
MRQRVPQGEQHACRVMVGRGPASSTNWSRTTTLIPTAAPWGMPRPSRTSRSTSTSRSRPWRTWSSSRAQPSVSPGKRRRHAQLVQQREQAVLGADIAALQHGLEPVEPSHLQPGGRRPPHDAGDHRPHAADKHCVRSTDGSLATSSPSRKNPRHGYAETLSSALGRSI